MNKDALRSSNANAQGTSTSLSKFCVASNHITSMFAFFLHRLAHRQMAILDRHVKRFSKASEIQCNSDDVAAMHVETLRRKVPMDWDRGRVSYTHSRSRRIHHIGSEAVTPISNFSASREASSSEQGAEWSQSR